MVAEPRRLSRRAAPFPPRITPRSLADGAEQDKGPLPRAPAYTTWTCTRWAVVPISTRVSGERPPASRRRAAALAPHSPLTRMRTVTEVPIIRRGSGCSSTIRTGTSCVTRV